jgi:phosphate/phosphite/phosphonate ABC transporter binding protein
MIHMLLQQYLQKTLFKFWLPLLGLTAFSLAGVVGSAPAEQPKLVTSSPVTLPSKVYRSANRPTQLSIALTPFLRAHELEDDLEPLRSYLSSQLKMPVSFIAAKSYSDAMKMLVEHEVDIADLTPGAYLAAKEVDPHIGIIAVTLSDGNAECSSYLLTREDSDITTIAQLKGKRLGLVDKESSTGFKMPVAYLRDMHIDVETFFGSIILTGNHQNLVDLLIQKKIDVGATSSLILKLANAQTERPRLRILAKAGRVPFGAYIASSNLPEEFVDEVRNALLDLSTRAEIGKRVLGGKNYTNGFIYADDHYYDELRMILSGTDQQ